jgi:hypothetical protein
MYRLHLRILRNEAKSFSRGLPVPLQRENKFVFSHIVLSFCCEAMVGDIVHSLETKRGLEFFDICCSLHTIPDKISNVASDLFFSGEVRIPPFEVP